MLEQPPERSLLEIEAAAAATEQASPQLRPHGCFRLLVWSMPTFLFWVTAAGAAYLHSEFFRADSPTTTFILFLFVVLALNYGIGCLDGLISRSNIAVSPELRKQQILYHAATFAGAQIVVIPALSVLLVGGCIVVTTFIRSGM